MKEVGGLASKIPLVFIKNLYIIYLLVIFFKTKFVGLSLFVFDIVIYNGFGVISTNKFDIFINNYTFYFF